MDRQEIFEPFLAMMVLTLAVWVYMYIRRTAYLLGQRVDLRSVDTPAKMDEGVPPAINLPAYALKNLFELPVLFYAFCLFIYSTGVVDEFYLTGAWIFVAGRAVHSAIYCTYNKVMHRFSAYFLSSLVLWVMILRAGIRLL